MEKNNNKLVIFLLIVVICLLAGGGFLLYKTMFNSSNSNVNLGGSNSINNQLDSGSATKTILIYDEKNIPQVNLDAASDFNNKVKSFYDRASKSVGNITFSDAIKDNILYCSVYYSYPSGMGGDFESASFIYDLINKKNMTVKEILSKYNMGVKADGVVEELEADIIKNVDNYIYLMPSAQGILKAYAVEMGPSVEIYYK